MKPLDCDGCVLKEKGKSFVPGIGDENAKILILGERPGKHEAGTCDCTPDAHPRGEPFVYKSGKEITFGLGGTRGGAYLTNVRKCLGGDKETPEIREASTAHCIKAYLIHELGALSSVRTVLAVGADALRATTGIKEITKFHGSVWTADEVRAMSQVITEAAEEENAEEEE